MLPVPRGAGRYGAVLRVVLDRRSTRPWTWRRAEVLLP
ncbi:hypothetical protein ACP70R_035458 [Stipagrostis hirtigluma subsp. patula]